MGYPIPTCWDIDPGLASFIMQQEQLSPVGFNHLINQEAGLAGISGTNGDMEYLLEHEANHRPSAEAIAYYCYQVKKNIGAFAAALGGLDALVFTGGIGEHAAAIRSRICSGLEHLHLSLDEGANGRNATQIGCLSNAIPVFVVPTDEEQLIARNTAYLLGLVHT